jgi:hypothetical protein
MLIAWWANRIKQSGAVKVVFWEGRRGEGRGAERGAVAVNASW